MIGTRLGPYEITDKLGEGGMGEVYRAHDTKLKRDVAIKVLPNEFTQDRERLSRFEREAQLLAQLHHPNIASIFGMEESEGTRALVMELVEGPTLAERLESGPLPFNESLSVSLQIAQALEEAHEKGIVHRDLKPQNVKASIEGKVKVLDFGLAKAMDSMGAASGSPSASQLAQSPTLTLGATVQGVILGTAAYMAPEQARGVAVDKRADIWAFGVVLFEMLTAKRLFDGELVTDVLADVMRQEIDFAALPAETPGAVRQLLRRCLERNPKNRLHDIADARIVLEEVIAGKSDDARPASAPAAAVPVPARRLAVPIVAAAVIALAVGVGIGSFRSVTPDSAIGDLRLGLALPPGWRTSEGAAPSLALSRDGHRRALVVSSDSHERTLFLGELGQVEWRAVADSEGAEAPFFSPDGSSVGFFAKGALRWVRVDGGPGATVAKVGVQIRGATWLPDGSIVYSPDAPEPLYRISESGGEPTPLTTLDGAKKERTHRWPEALPDGSAVLFTVDDTATTEFYDDANIEAVEVATGKRTVVLRGSSQARYLDPGMLIFARGGSLFAIRFDPKKLATTGAAMPVLQGIATAVASGAAQFAVSGTGTLAWIPGQASTYGSAPIWMDRRGKEERMLAGERQFSQLALSPDGKRLALTGGDGQTSDIWVADLERGSISRLTFGESVGDPTWSADGTRVAYASLPGTVPSRTGSQISWKLADGSGEKDPLVESPNNSSVGSFSADGRYLAFERSESLSARSDLWILPLAGDREPWQFTKTDFSEFQASFSPDGKWLSYASDESGAIEIYVRPFPAGGGRWQVSTDGGIEPRWSPDGGELFYRRSGILYRVAVDTRNGFYLGNAERVSAGFRPGANPRSYSVAPDGQRFALLPAWGAEATANQLNLALRWDREVERQLAGRR